MSKHYSYLVSSALIQGIFTGFYIKTGIDAAPISIAKQIIEMLEPMVSDVWSFQIEMIKYTVEIMGFILLIPIVIGIIMVGWKKGLIVFFGVFISMIVLVTNV